MTNKVTTKAKRAYIYESARVCRCVISYYVILFNILTPLPGPFLHTLRSSHYLSINLATAVCVHRIEPLSNLRKKQEFSYK